jgi:hypothetical protein
VFLVKVAARQAYQALRRLNDSAVRQDRRLVWGRVWSARRLRWVWASSPVRKVTQARNNDAGETGQGWRPVRLRRITQRAVISG